jgi:peptidoglycan/xylan/chitin deacetylase (PgdA/CDA1 family)
LGPLDWFGRVLARPALKMRARQPPRWLVVLLYHRVLPLPTPGFSLDRAVVDSDPARFEQHMRFVASACTPIGLSQLLGFLRGEERMPDNPVLVTFDDGYLDNREHALPILLRHGIRGLFFVTSSYVTHRRLFWWDRLAYLFHNARVAVGRMSYPTELILRMGEGRARSERTALRIIKTHRGLDVERFLKELGAALEVAWDADLDRRLADKHIMTWDDVRALRQAGMDIGSHTRTHRVLDTVEPASLAAELADSKADIEREIGAPVSSLAYPVGRPIRRLPILERAVRDAGYEVGFSVETRANSLHTALDRFNVMRLPVSSTMSPDRLAALLAAPELAGVV